mmetsp:Transcript_164244/g.522342  ORF Transcript_164244/g.522342 Transcript_164244/m.522342 type:complete len:159 (+) Transcript_164244:497-973(+)
MLLSPQLGRQLVGLADCLRFGDLAISQRSAEVVILYLARLHCAEYPFWSHTKIGKAAGLSDETVEALRLGRRPPTLEPDEAAALDLATALLEGSGGGEAVSDDAYRAAVQVLGERGVFEIVTLTGFYTTLARVVNAFRVPVPTGEPRPFEGGPPASRL